MDDIELETRSMVDEGAELKHGVTCLRSRPIENSLFLDSLICYPIMFSVNHAAIFVWTFSMIFFTRTFDPA